MRLLKFPSHEAVKPNREAPAVARAWIILYQSIASYPCGNKEQTATVAGATNALKEASVLILDERDNETRRLKPEGVDVYLEDAEWRAIDKALEKYREQITGGNSDALLMADQLLESAATISKKQYAERKPAIVKEG